MTPDLEKILTADELFEKLRGGNTQKLEIGLTSDYMIPVRLLSAKEEAIIVARATQKAQTTNLSNIEPRILISYETMIAVLREATSIKGAVGINQETLERLPSPHLAALFDQYTTLTKTINPNFQTMSIEEIESLVQNIREKKTLVNDCFTWQLAAVGKYFLEAIQRASPTGSVPGSH